MTENPHRENVHLSHPSVRSFYARVTKRWFDIVASSLALLCLLPILTILTVCLWISLRGNPFFVQTRIGRDLKPFSIVKFKTMTDQRDADGVLLPDEERTTRLGLLLRSTSVDELPELLNVLVGHMSLIGPRPWIPEQMATFSLSTRRKRMAVRPGLSGLAQVFGRNNLTFRQRVCYDLVYQRHMSFRQDMGLIFYTVYKVFKREGIAQRLDALGITPGHLPPKDPDSIGLKGNDVYRYSRR